MNKIADLTSCATLNNGIKMPWVGFGVFKVNDGDEVIAAVTHALQAGYRHVDTASAYRNESGVGTAIAQSGVQRTDLFVTSKLWNADQGYDSTLRAFDASLERLGLDYLDLYLIHWPLPMKGLYKDSWRALEKLYKDRRVRAIGVSNFQPNHLEDIMANSEVVPAVNQVEFHPRLTQEPLREFCGTHKIQVEAWSPLMRAQLIDDPTIARIATVHGRTPAQVILRWDLQHEVVTIPKSVTPERIIENSRVFDFELSEAEIREIDSLNSNERSGPDPDTFDMT
ncbi:MAG: aldo/keto reductase [Spirochaetaceae bacterium]|nr:MAG: aldo/keto reductase [Spirochaetaceae bacterium]